MLRATTAVIGGPQLASLHEAHLMQPPHHLVAVGTAAGAGGLDDDEAALVALYRMVAGSAFAAVRLLGLDPVAVERLVWQISQGFDQRARDAAETALGPLECLPAPSAPGMDLLAEARLDRREHLFAS